MIPTFQDTVSLKKMTRVPREIVTHPMSFTIRLSSEYHPGGKALCYPGAIIHGTVEITLAEPLKAQSLKLVFKAAERLNYDVLGWNSNESDGKLFGVKTILWGLAHNSESPESVWPTMEAGHFTFPFICELPLINYPPSFNHSLIACTFSLVASIERPNKRSFSTTPYFLQYHPMIETCPMKTYQPYQQIVDLTSSSTARISLPSLSYNILDSKSVPVKVDLLSTHLSNRFPMATHLIITLKRFMKISRGNFYRNETVLISEVERRIDTTIKQLLIHLPLISENTNLKTTATLNYSRYLSLTYKISIGVKYRHAPFVSTKKLLCVIPIQLGTLPTGCQAPSEMMVFTEPRVSQDTTVLTRPKFIKSSRLERDSQLPVYDEKKPPSYTP
ncbi:hypothetical protein BDF14DRAFT_1775950 [Spinellus fusiger]|nr:hypothetical protein BDF14DRAFT_1775950 [Spinellus fusiger]